MCSMPLSLFKHLVAGMRMLLYSKDPENNLAHECGRRRVSIYRFAVCH